MTANWFSFISGQFSGYKPIIQNVTYVSRLVNFCSNILLRSRSTTYHIYNNVEIYRFAEIVAEFQLYDGDKPFLWVREMHFKAHKNVQESPPEDTCFRG